MKKRKLSVRVACLATVMAFTAGCTTDPYTGEERLSKTGGGAMIGAAGGAVIGAIAKGRKGALIGAGIGALAGGAVGYYMDQQEEKLRQQLRGTGVSVTREGNNIRLNMPGNITFATDSADINASFYEVLNSVVLVLKEFDKTVIQVAGHTDNTGSAQYNQELSERRAASVAQYLRSQGIAPVRIETYGLGLTRPIASNATASGRQLNRRVELTLVPLT